MTSTTDYIGKPTSRVDGRAKVTGEGKYAAEYNVPNLTYGVVVSSGIAKGSITKIDTSDALAVKGVLQVFTHENAPSTAWFDRSHKDDIAPPGSPFRPLRGKEIIFSGQPIALVVAEEFEIARFAATLVRVEYEIEAHVTDLESKEAHAKEPPTGKAGFVPPPKPRGDAEKALSNATAKVVDLQYYQPSEHHNPMEPFASTVVYNEEDGGLLIYDKTQGVQNVQRFLSSVFNLAPTEARVLSPFMGGGFGSGLRPQYPPFLAVLAAKALKRSVRVSYTRQQMFDSSHRPETIQTLSLGADQNGFLEAIVHDALAETSTFEDHEEVVVNWSGLLYRCDNVKLGYKLGKLNVHSPGDMRAPGAVTGIYALECAMDELAYAAGMDPLEFRIKNYAENDQNDGKPFSSKELRACYKQGADKFGWSKRKHEPRSMRQGDNLIGWGVATGAWDAQQGKSNAKAVLSVDGKLLITSATSDIGTGTYTALTIIAAETLGVPIEDVTCKLADSLYPAAPVEGGSWTVSSVGTAVKAACELIQQTLFKLARKMDNSPLAKAEFDEVVFADGAIKVKADPIKSVTYTEAMRHGGVNVIEEETTTLPKVIEQNKYTMSTHSAVFVEVQVDADLGGVQVTRVVSAIAGGRIINPKTARSQVLGAVVWGISMALEEESMMDQKIGRFMNHNLAEYHIPVNADIHDIEVIFVEEHDDIINPLGAKGLGEIGIVGVAAAVANAVYHATGKRVRDLPITPDKLL